MPDENNYVSHILDLRDALQKLRSTGGDKEAIILDMAYAYWEATVAYSRQEAARSLEASNASQRPHSR